MDEFCIHDKVERSEYAPSLLERIRTERRIMDEHCIHDKVERSEYAPSLLERIRTE